MIAQWHTLLNLYDEIRADPTFAHLRAGKNRLVPGEGSITPRVLVIGEAPGAQEAMKLRPFVGKSGVMLRRLMGIAGLHSQPFTFGKITGFRVPHGCQSGIEMPPNCFITNVIKYRPIRNRTPVAHEIDLARPYLKREWRALGRPKIIVCVGAVALRATLNNPSYALLSRAGQPITRSSTRNNLAVTVWPMVHPGYALRRNDDAYRAELEGHWERLGEWLDNDPRHHSE